MSASPGDAVTTAALELQAALARLGRSEIFARYHDPALAGRVLPLDRFPPAGANGSRTDLLVFHASIGDADVAAFLDGRPERLAIVYHNISPASAFRPFDPAFADLLDAGRRQLAGLRDRTVLALADSAFNAVELETLGFGDVRVTPLVVDVEALRQVQPDPATEHHLNEQVDGPVLVFVGQLLPHKRPDLLLQAFHVVSTYLLPDAHLILVGPARLEGYRRAIQHYVRELSLGNAWVTGFVPREALAAFYRRADAFVTASEHEGFCVPLLEAMAFDLPVLARRRAAIPETLGDAGILLPAEDDPLLLAEAMTAVLTDEPLRSELVDRGRRRLGHFDPEKAVATIVGHLLDVA